MQALSIFTKILPFLLSLVQSVETLNKGDKGTGPQKKQAVKEGLGAIFQGVKAVSTGGQAQTLETLTPVLEPLIDKGIDAAAALMFPKDKDR